MWELERKIKWYVFNGPRCSHYIGHYKPLAVTSLLHRMCVARRAGVKTHYSVCAKNTTHTHTQRERERERERETERERDGSMRDSRCDGPA